jgi:hypothetical protein
VAIIPARGGGREKDGRGEFNYDIL